MPNKESSIQDNSNSKYSAQFYSIISNLWFCSCRPIHKLLLLCCLAGLHVLDKTNKNKIKNGVKIKKTLKNVKTWQKLKKTFLRLWYLPAKMKATSPHGQAQQNSTMQEKTMAPTNVSGGGALVCSTAFTGAGAPVSMTSCCGCCCWCCGPDGG